MDEPLAAERSVRLAVARLDKLDTVISGNKWFKLRHNLELAQCQGYRRIVSFGGPWSNHIHALAWAGHRLGIDTLGIIRGYESLPDTAMLQDARAWGMTIDFVDRSEYRLKSDEHWLSRLQNRYGPCYVVPEGGCNAAGIEGCKAILASVAGAAEPYTAAVIAVGTGATLAGLLQAPNGIEKILGVSVLKGDRHARQRVAQLLPPSESRQLAWDIDTEHHFGGYARVNASLLRFIETFYQRHGIALEPVYTGKMFYALYQRLEAGWFSPGESIIAIHSGGMQGLRGYADKWPWAASQLAAGLDKS